MPDRSREMRPASDIRLALLEASVLLTTPERSPTLRELAAHANVGQDSALHTVKNMVRSGDLKIARERKVSYRNKPVAEYAPKAGTVVSEASPAAWRSVFANWVAPA